MVKKLDDRGGIMDISDSISNVKRRIEKAALRVFKDSKEVTLVAVSKTKPIEMLMDAYGNGIRDFGENKVQELVEKYPLANDVSWHMIGHLQRNKVKYIIDKVHMIHSLDSIELAKEIDKRAGNINKKIPCLVQINIGREETKSGIFKEDLTSFLKELSCFKNIVVAGLMTVPPACDDPEDARVYFKSMKVLFEEIKQLNYINFDIKYLSMGMSGDFEIAIEEGANIVRVGTGIFGKRNYKGRDEIGK